MGISNKIQGRNTMELEDMTNLTKDEMEIVVNYNVGEQMAIVHTRDKSVMQELDSKKWIGLI